MFMLVYICIIYLWKYSQEMSNICLRGRFKLSLGGRVGKKTSPLYLFLPFELGTT